LSHSVSAAEFGDRLSTTPYLAALDRRRHHRHHRRRPDPAKPTSSSVVIIGRPDRPSSIVATNQIH
jgi:hypothetical protein